jgi:organic radical activating enzyme
MSKEMYRNFTAILPVTCNANCVFCPEKEMDEKASKADWLNGLVTSLFENRKRVDHVSISGGEPTLNVKLLQQAVDTILTETHIISFNPVSVGVYVGAISFICSASILSFSLNHSLNVCSIYFLYLMF